MNHDLEPNQGCVLVSHSDGKIDSLPFVGDPGLAKSTMAALAKKGRVAITAVTVVQGCNDDPPPSPAQEGER